VLSVRAANVIRLNNFSQILQLQRNGTLLVFYAFLRNIAPSDKRISRFVLENVCQ